MSKENVKPWDIFNKNMERSLPLIAKQRLAVCKQCPRFVRFTHQCKECGCIMDTKVKLADSKCPLDKWESVDLPIDREMTDEDFKTLGDKE